MIAALLLDMDGTLVDSEPVHFRAHEQFLASVGVAVSHDDLVGNIGKGDVAFYADLARRAGVTADPEQWVLRKRDVLLEIFRRDGLAAHAGARALLDAAFARGIPRMLVTNSDRAVAAVAVDAAGLADRLTGRVCWEDTVAHKPDPAPYRLAAQRLAVPPAHCIAIEDSPSGVRAAVAAGCRTLAVAGLVAPAELLAAGARTVLPSLVVLADDWAQLERWAT